KENIRGSKCKLLIKCNDCNYEWEISITSHITKKRGCPKCTIRNPYVKLTLESFISRGREINGLKFDYSKITENHIKHGRYSKFPIKCNDCNYEWETNVANHIDSKCGCPNCNDHIRWTLEKLRIEAYKVLK